MTELGVGDMNHLVRVARRYCRRRDWRRAVVLRSTRFALTLAAVEAALGDRYSRREKNGEDRRWFVYGRDDQTREVLAAIVGGGSTRRLEEVRAPIRIELLAPSLFDLVELCATTGAKGMQRSGGGGTR